MLSRRRGQSRLSFAALMSNSASFHPADLPRVSGRRLRSRVPGEGSLTPFSDPSKRELWRGSLISLPRFALSPAPLFPATHLWWLWTGLISVCHWPVRCAWVCARFSREKAVNKMTLLFPLSYHVEKPIMVMLSMSGNLCLSLLSPCPLHSCSYPPPPTPLPRCRGFTGLDNLFGLLCGHAEALGLDTTFNTITINTSSFKLLPLKRLGTLHSVSIGSWLSHIAPIARSKTAGGGVLRLLIKELLP